MIFRVVRIHIDLLIEDLQFATVLPNDGIAGGGGESLNKNKNDDCCNDIYAFFIPKVSCDA